MNLLNRRGSKTRYCPRIFFVLRGGRLKLMSKCFIIPLTKKFKIFWLLL